MHLSITALFVFVFVFLRLPVCMLLAYYRTFGIRIKMIITIGLTIRAKMRVGRPEILGQSDHVGAKSPIFDLFSPVAPQP